MKQFLKMTLATMCGIVILSLIAGLFFFISLVGMLASESTPTKVKDNSVFVLKLNGVVNERSAEGTPFDELLGMGGMNTIGLDELVSSIRKAKDEEHIKGIYIEGCSASFDSPATAQQLRDALKDFKRSGKWVVSYADNYSQTAYYVATVADKIYLNGEGTVDLRGLGGKNEYYKGLYDKLGVKYMAVKVGKYKSFVESDTQTGMSAYDREQREAYLNGIWNYWLKEMAEGRKVNPAALNKLVNDSLLIFAASNDYVKAKLVDKVLYPEEVKVEVKKLLKLDKDDEVPQLTLADMSNVKGKKKESGEKVAVYYAYGTIVDNESVGMLSGADHCIVGKTVAEDLRKLADDDAVKAVVFRVNSGGGSAVASEQIRHAIKLLKAKKPVVVSMGGAAASGGYWISSAANYIYAEPTTITGSIGIFGLIPNVSGLVTDKLGVTYDGVKTHQFAGFESELVFGKDTTAILNQMQHFINRGYQNFLTIVSEGRGLKPEQVDAIGQGRVWLASDAVKIKLVDKLGSLDDAVKKAAELAKVKAYYAASYPAEPDWLEKLMAKENKGSYLDGELRELLGDAYLPLMQIRYDIKSGSRVQARLLDDIRVK